LQKFMKKGNSVRRGAREAMLRYFASRPLMVFRDRCTNISERIDSGLLLEAVGGDALVALDDVAKEGGNAR
jgi:hypothetical protein